MAGDPADLFEGAEDDSEVPVTVTMAILAVLVAVVSLFGGRSHAYAMISQTAATDQWGQYQAKVIRERSYELFLDQLTVFNLQDPSRAGEIKAKYVQEIDQYREELKDIQARASATDADVKSQERKSNWYDLGEVLIDSGLVICSFALLREKRIYWYAGLVAGSAGVVVALAGLFIR